MKQAIIDYLPYLLSVVAIYQIHRTGNHKKDAWAIMFGNQMLWFVWIYFSGVYGLLPLTIAFTVVAIQNHYKWNKKSNS